MSEPNPDPAPVAATRTVPVADAERTVRRAGSWFFWVAALSVVNSVAAATNMNFRMLLGLGITQALDVLLPAGQAVQLVLLALVLGFFVLVGYLATRRLSLPWYLAGMIVYGVDALLCVWIGDWAAVAFHGFVLYMLWGGFTVLRALPAQRPA
ncbi:MAG TPA: hypothetical protein VH109_11530 [Steroidobacteraceae bacterium]|jgi:hypothetical protein|nr:hypothetical protein [Steroidobacteraceae bacterium]